MHRSSYYITLLLSITYCNQSFSGLRSLLKPLLKRSCAALAVASYAKHRLYNDPSSNFSADIIKAGEQPLCDIYTIVHAAPKHSVTVPGTSGYQEFTVDVKTLYVIEKCYSGSCNCVTKIIIPFLFEQAIKLDRTQSMRLGMTCDKHALPAWFYQQNEDLHKMVKERYNDPHGVRALRLLRRLKLPTHETDGIMVAKQQILITSELVQQKAKQQDTFNEPIIVLDDIPLETISQQLAPPKYDLDVFWGFDEYPRTEAELLQADKGDDDRDTPKGQEKPGASKFEPIVGNDRTDWGSWRIVI